MVLPPRLKLKDPKATEGASQLEAYVFINEKNH
jgi:hypothetical protein